MSRGSKVELYEKIRKAREREQLSIRGLADRFHVHRRDVRAALSSAVPPPRKRVVRPAPVLDRWKPTIDAWLEADKAAPRKQRHTARRVWQRLVEEHDAEVGESTVRNYVAEVRRRQSVPLVEVMVPQHHPLGAEAEVDFGSIHVHVSGVLTELPLFLMRLSASCKGFVRAYLNECQAVFLDGHVRGSEQLGGVPDRIRHHNLKAAVTKVLKGRTRVEAERFVALRSHYGFDSFFCQPGIKGSHEKGGVESEVGRFRGRHLVPVPHVASMAELNELVAAAMERDDHRRIAHRQIAVGEHFALAAERARSPRPARTREPPARPSPRLSSRRRPSWRHTDAATVERQCRADGVGGRTVGPLLQRKEGDPRRRRIPRAAPLRGGRARPPRGSVSPRVSTHNDVRGAHALPRKRVSPVVRSGTCGQRLRGAAPARDRSYALPQSAPTIVVLAHAGARHVSNSARLPGPVAGVSYVRRREP